jgi:predicted nucleic acid-binding Zn ribbon protein
MKTTYEKLCKYGIDPMVFGKSKKKEYLLYWLLISVLIVMGIVL